MHSNRELTALIECLIGDGFKKDADELMKLTKFAEDEAFRSIRSRYLIFSSSVCMSISVSR